MKHLKGTRANRYRAEAVSEVAVLAIIFGIPRENFLSVERFTLSLKFSSTGQCYLPSLTPFSEDVNWFCKPASVLVFWQRECRVSWNRKRIFFLPMCSILGKCESKRWLRITSQTLPIQFYSLFLIPRTEMWTEWIEHPVTRVQWHAAQLG